MGLIKRNNTMNKISLLVVEDHKLYSTALEDLITKDENLQVIDIVPTAEEALEILDNSKVDLVLVDVGLPRIDGISLVKMICDKNATIPCLMISGHLSHNYVQKSVDAGARGYLLKENYSDILEGIWCVINGGRYFSKRLGQIDSISPQSEQLLSADGL